MSSTSEVSGGNRTSKSKRSAAAAIQTLATSPEEAAAAAGRDKLMAGLAGHIATPGLSIPYRLGLLLVAATMLLLPAIYVALIGLVGWGTWLHATQDAGILSHLADGRRAGGRGALFVALLVIAAYVGPILIGCIAILFMVKPLFSRRRESEATLALSRQEYPLLFEFVDRLARHVGAPSPRSIEVDCDVNAHARFRRGLASAISGDGDLVLRIGLPLAGNLPLASFAGILAHEFGHFAQRGGMTLTYVIRSINGWFARVVYERDHWDEQLESASRDGGHWTIMLVASLARLFVWMSRKVLWLLMVVGHGIASVMARQMEYDADRYQTLLVGPKRMAATFGEAQLIGLASHQAYESVGAAWNERRLPDDLIALIAQQYAAIPPEARKKFAAAATQGSKTGWFDTHPAERDRVAAANKLATKGTFDSTEPGSAIFGDGYGELCKRATLARYFELLGNQVKPESLVPVSRVIASDEQKVDQFKSLERYTQGVIHPIALEAPASLPPLPKDVDGATMRLLELRNALLDLAPPARAALEELSKADDKRTRVGQVKAMNLAGIAKVPAKAMGFVKADAAELAAETAAADRVWNAAKPAVEAAQAAAIERLTIALSLEPATTVPAAKPKPKRAAAEAAADTYDIVGGETYDVAGPGDPRSTAALVSALAQLGTSRQAVDALAEDCARQRVLLGCIQGRTEDQTLIGAIVSRGRSIADALGRLRDALPTTAYPYDHADAGGISIRTFIIGAGGVPPREEPVLAFEAAQGAVGRYISFYGRVLSDLVHRAEAVEAHLGLSPMELPKEEKK